MTTTTHPSAAERLAAAITKAHNQHFPEEPWTYEPDGAVRDILAADPTLAQDIEDITELRLLREAVVSGPLDSKFRHAITVTFSDRGVHVFAPTVHFSTGYPTIAAAAKACREALEGAK